MTDETKKQTVLAVKTASKEIEIMRRSMEMEKETRLLREQYIKENLVQGVDYGGIHINKNCQSPWDCKNKNHFSKPILFKSGSEKFMSLLHLTAKFKKDVDTWQMLGEQKGLVAYICELYNSKGEMMGEGRGAASMSESGATPNTIIKKAEKRAQMDAILRTGGLSDVFTQDLDDMDQPIQNTSKAAKPGPVTTPKVNGSKLVNNSQAPASRAQINYIYRLLKQKGKTEDGLFISLKIDSLEQMTSSMASMTIDKLNELPDKLAKNPEEKKLHNEDVNPDDIPDDISK